MPHPVLLFDYGETLVRYMRHGQFRTILAQSIDLAKTAARDLGYPVPTEREIQRRVQAENYSAKNSRVRPLEMRLARIFGLPRARVALGDRAEVQPQRAHERGRAAPGHGGLR